MQASPCARRRAVGCLAMFVVSLRWTTAVPNCAECGPGTYGPGGRRGSERNCTSCTAGTFSAAIGAQDESTCRPCRAGTYSNASGQGFCLACPEGSSSESGASECHECAPGTYSGADDFGICKRCPVGTWSNKSGLASASDCTPCAAGSFGSSTGENSSDACEPCRAGTYSAAGSGQCDTCPPGESSPIGASRCTKCDPGTYSGADDFGLCKRCPVGTWSNRSGLASAEACDDCPAGTFSGETAQTSAATCRPCRAGTYSNASGQGFCLACPEGSSSESGASECHECAPGTYSGADDFGICKRCPVGTWSNKSGLASAEACDDCPAGTFGAATGSNSSDMCEPCMLATYSSQGGVGQCKLCPAGYSTDGPGATECIKCQPGFYSTSESSCRLCKHPLSSTDGSATCPFCVEGYYFIDTNSDGEPCNRCPDNTNCKANSTVETMELQVGFWRASRSTDSIVQCRRYSDGWSRCMGGMSAGEEGDGYCQAGFAGPECELCADVDGKRMHRVGTSRCEPCFSESSTPTARTAAAIGKLIGACLAVALLVGSLVLVHRQQAWRDRRVVGPCLKFSDRCIARSHAIGLAAKAKILVGFIQVVLSLSSNYRVRWPPAYQAFGDSISRFDIDPIQLFLPSDCFPYRVRLLLYEWGPFTLIACVLAVGLLLRLKEWRASAPPRRSLAEAVKDGLLDWTPAALVIVFMAVPLTSAYTFQAWSCKWYYTSLIKPPNGSVTYSTNLLKDLRLECDSEEHREALRIAVGSAILWPLGSLVLFAALLVPVRRPLLQQRPNSLSRATSFLHREYKLQWYWWEEVELARKIMLTGFFGLIGRDEAGSFVQLIFATVLSTVYAVLVALVQPFKRFEDAMLASAAAMVVALFFAGSQLSTVWMAIDERSGRGEEGQSDAEAITGMRSPNAILLFLLVLTAVLLFLFIVGGVVGLRRIAGVPTIRLSRTGQRPELSLHRGVLWHLFNSHIWSTGQDAAAAIKKELQLLLPGINVFLDVDDLDDIGALETYIRQSQLILCFLSRGYLRSANCLREVCAALDQGKAIVLVQEADPAKGGGSLPELRAECEIEEVATGLFDGGHPHVVWQRFEEFRVVSLKEIARAVLLHSPNYQGVAQLPLHIPGELQQKTLALKGPVALWVSSANVGARELADELCETIGGITVVTARGRLTRARGQRGSQARRGSISEASTEASADFRAEASEGPEEGGQVQPPATHLLLYLSEETWKDDRLVEQVQAARADKLPIVMAHETRPQRGGCQFSRFFETTPQVLVAGGLYKELAIACIGGAHRDISLRLLAMALGAKSSGGGQSCLPRFALHGRAAQPQAPNP